MSSWARAREYILAETKAGLSVVKRSLIPASDGRYRTKVYHCGSGR